ncbi:MAG: DUF1365 domain-containing protein [Acidobacteriota bacterium]|nr:DUF1365 domain-containing protein [Acidobacteriota bacterium]
MQSCIYEGSVRHRRLAPRKHVLRYRVFMMYLDLDEVHRVFQSRWFWSNRRFNLAQFRRQDHMGDRETSLSESICQLVEQKTGRRPTGPIRLLTHLRYFGYVFNPVSFYFCFDDEDKHLETIVAEVNNTPWKEQHCYVLDSSINQDNGQSFHFQLDKNFHVSPFMPMDLQYRWKFNQPGKRLAVHMENFRLNTKFFDATLSLCRREITGASLARVLVQYPLMTSRIVSAIHWNALLLWLKGCPVFTHPRKSNLEIQRS